MTSNFVDIYGDIKTYGCNTIITPKKITSSLSKNVSLNKSKVQFEQDLF